MICGEQHPLCRSRGVRGSRVTKARRTAAETLRHIICTVFAYHSARKRTSRGGSPTTASDAARNAVFQDAIMPPPAPDPAPEP